MPLRAWLASLLMLATLGSKIVPREPPGGLLLGPRAWALGPGPGPWVWAPGLGRLQEGPERKPKRTQTELQGLVWIILCLFVFGHCPFCFTLFIVF